MQSLFYIVNTNLLGLSNKLWISLKVNGFETLIQNSCPNQNEATGPNLSCKSTKNSCKLPAELISCKFPSKLSLGSNPGTVEIRRPDR